MITKVNITSGAEKIAKSGGMFVVSEQRTIAIGEEERTQDIVAIGEEGSDFLIEYGVGRDGSLFHIVSPSYIEDLPAHIKSSVKLKHVVKYAVECCR